MLLYNLKAMILGREKMRSEEADDGCIRSTHRGALLHCGRSFSCLFQNRRGP